MPRMQLLYSISSNLGKKVLSEACELNFVTIKKDISTHVLLKYPRMDLYFCLLIDASVVSTCTILYQMDTTLVIGFSSKI